MQKTNNQKNHQKHHILYNPPITMLIKKEEHVGIHKHGTGAGELEV